MEIVEGTKLKLLRRQFYYYVAFGGKTLFSSAVFFEGKIENINEDRKGKKYGQARESGRE